MTDQLKNENKTKLNHKHNHTRQNSWEEETFGKKREKNKSPSPPHLLKPTNKFLFFYSHPHFDDVAKKILTKYRAPNPISIACFIKDLGAAALNRKKNI